MQLLLELTPNGDQTLQEQIVKQLHGLIKNGQLLPGALIPGSRELSLQLSVSRNTVSEAYSRLIEEGYLVARHKVGTFVSQTSPQSATTIGRIPRPGSRVRSIITDLPLPHSVRGLPGLQHNHDVRIQYDFTLGSTDAKMFPERIWRRAILEALPGAACRMSQYSDPLGLPELREQIAHLLAPARGIVVTPEQVMIVGGGQQGLNLAARLFVGRDTSVAIEAPCYRGAAFVFEGAGAQVIPVVVDEEGIRVDLLPDSRVKLVCITPSHQFPTGITMSLRRRLELLEWASRVGAYILEVDYDTGFRYEGSPLPSLWALDSHDCVIYVSSFSRTLGPGLRQGYVVVPDRLIDVATRAKALLDNGSSWLEQAALARFIQDGSFDHHLKRLRTTNRQRRDALIKALTLGFEGIAISGAESGTHLLCRLPSGAPLASELQSLAYRVGVGIQPIAQSAACFFESLPDLDRTLLFGYNHLREDHIRRGIYLLAQACDHPHVLTSHTVGS